MGRAQGANAAVRRLAEAVGAAAAEQLGFRRKLAVDFKPDDQFVLFHAVLIMIEFR